MNSSISKRIARAAISLSLVGLLAVPAVAAVQGPPIPPGAARVWFMRELEPGTNMYSPQVYADGVAIGQSSQSTMFYRDVPAGTHMFAVENCVPEPGSERTLNLAPRQEVSLQITALQGYTPWHCSPSDAYYLSPVPAQMQQYYLARLSNLGAR